MGNQCTASKMLYCGRIFRFRSRTRARVGLLCTRCSLAKFVVDIPRNKELQSSSRVVTMLTDMSDSPNSLTLESMPCF